MQPLWAVLFWLALAFQGTGIFWLALASKAQAEYAALTTQGAGLLVALTSRVRDYFWCFVSQRASLAPIFVTGPNEELYPHQQPVVVHGHEYEQECAQPTTTRAPLHESIFNK